MGESTNDKGEDPARHPLRVPRFRHAAEGARGDRGITPLSAESEYIPQTPVQLSEEQATEVLKLVDRLEEDEDVQKVFHSLV